MELPAAGELTGNRDTHPGSETPAGSPVCSRRCLPLAQEQGTRVANGMKECQQSWRGAQLRVSQGAGEARAVARMLRAGAGSWAEAAAAQAELQPLQTLTELCRAPSSSEGRWGEMRTGINYRKTDRAHTCHKLKKIEKQSQPSIVIKRKWFGLWMRADLAEAHKAKAGLLDFALCRRMDLLWVKLTCNFQLIPLTLSPRAPPL